MCLSKMKATKLDVDGELILEERTTDSTLQSSRYFVAAALALLCGRFSFKGGRDGLERSRRFASFEIEASNPLEAHQWLFSASPQRFIIRTICTQFWSMCLEPGRQWGSRSSRSLAAIWHTNSSQR